MNFNESVEYLYALGNEVLAMKLGLENIRILLAALGNPQNNYLKVQVAGTNGKGSVCAFLEAICVSAKIKIGLTTSPHLVSITERIKIGGREISEKDFARHATIVRKAAEKLLENGKLEAIPTFFEQVTAIALNFFAEEKIELAILETGLGGRFDATTAANAEIVAITPVDYDHQRILGNSLSEIAAEKAAIIRADTKVIAANQLKEAEKVVLDRCANFGVSPKLTAKVAAIEKSEITNNFSSRSFDKTKNERQKVNYRKQINFKTEKETYENVQINLPGKHQIENAKVALLLAETLRENFEITKENIIEGLQTAKHKGRIEFYKNFLFDGAHNVSGAKALKEFLDEFIEQPVTLIFGAMKDKDLTEIAEILFPKAEKLILTAPDNPRSMKAKELQKFVSEDFNKENVYLSETVEEALKTAENISNNDLILITGSLYLIGEAQKILKNQSEV